MKTSIAGVQLIKRFEGFSATKYQDSAGYWTIGFGHRIEDTDDLWHVTEEEAQELLKEDLEEAEEAVMELIDIPLDQHQFDALVSFTFNLGRGALAKSSLRKVVNRGEHELTAKEFTKWVYAGGKPLKGLARRRLAEAEHYLS